MNYEDFKNYLKENILFYLPKEFKDSTVEINKFNKQNNIKLDGLVVIPNIKGNIMAPVIYLNDIYEDYKEHNNINYCLFEISHIIKSNQEPTKNIKNFNFENFKDNIYFEVLNKGLNTSLLENIPYVDFLDLIIVFRGLVKKGTEGIQSFSISNEIAESLGLNNFELFDLSMKNTERIFPHRIYPVEDAIKKMIKNNDGDLKLFDDILGDFFQTGRIKMYVLTNDIGINGASVLLYKNLMKKISDKFNKDLFILPSSTNELIVVPDNNLDVNELKQMVNEVNIKEVSQNDILSNNVYRFKRDIGKITF